MRLISAMSMVEYISSRVGVLEVFVGASVCVPLRVVRSLIYSCAG
jgi:hypothetical protein